MNQRFSLNVNGENHDVEAVASRALRRRPGTTHTSTAAWRNAVAAREAARVQRA
jgi:hypothetical protein